jgi:hypothetical protein
MNLAPYNYTGPSGVATILDGTAGSHFVATIVNTSIQPSAIVNWTITNSGKDPYPSGKTLRGSTIELLIKTTGATLGADLSALSSVFDVHDTTLRTLICKDSDDSSRQWYAQCTPTDMPKNTGKGVTVKLAVKSAYWLTVNDTTESTWSVTASGQTHNYVVSLGNVEALPKIRITPTAAKGVIGGGGTYKRFITMYNYTRKAAHAYPIDVTDGGLNTQAIIQDATVSNQINHVGGYTSSDTTFVIDTSVGGGLAASGGMWYCQRTGEQGSYTAISAGSMTGIVRGIGGTTATALLDNDILVNSKMLANGDDLLIFVGNANGRLVEVPRWFGTAGTAQINSTATKIWISHTFAVRAQGTLAATINNSITTFTLNQPEGDVPTSGGLALCGTEIMTVDSFNTSTNVATGCLRGRFGTTAAGHTAGAKVVFLPQAWMFYGDASAPTPVYSDANKPTISLSSTNSSWVYTAFSTDDQTDVTKWQPIRNGADAVVYTKDQDPLNAAPIDPVTDIGVSLINKSSQAAWQLTLPFGYTSAAFTNVDRYNLPASQAYYRDAQSGDSLAVTRSTSNNTWQSTSQTFTPAATGFVLQLFLKNVRTTNYTTRAAVSAGGCTVTLDTTTTGTQRGVPNVSLGAEQIITYALNVTLTNNTTGESIQIVHPMETNETVEIDTMNKTVTYLKDNSDIFPALHYFQARNEWFRLVQGTNTISYTETGVTGVDVVFIHKGRSNTAA